MSETTEVLSQAVWEIQRLRQENEILKAKVSVLDVFAAALAPEKQMQMQTQAVQQIDILWHLQRHLEEQIQTEKVTGRLSGVAGLQQAQGAMQNAQVQPLYPVNP